MRKTARSDLHVQLSVHPRFRSDPENSWTRTEGESGAQMNVKPNRFGLRKAKIPGSNPGGPILVPLPESAKSVRKHELLPTST